MRVKLDHTGKILTRELSHGLHTVSVLPSCKCDQKADGIGRPLPGFLSPYVVEGYVAPDRPEVRVHQPLMYFVAAFLVALWF